MRPLPQPPTPYKPRAASCEVGSTLHHTAVECENGARLRMRLAKLQLLGSCGWRTWDSQHLPLEAAHILMDLELLGLTVQK
jgi:hypothetical protein